MTTTKKYSVEAQFLRAGDKVTVSGVLCEVEGVEYASDDASVIVSFVDGPAVLYPDATRLEVEPGLDD